MNNVLTSACTVHVGIDGGRGLNRVLVVSSVFVMAVSAASASAAESQFGTKVGAWDSVVPVDSVDGMTLVDGSVQMRGDFVVSSTDGRHTVSRARRRSFSNKDFLPLGDRAQLERRVRPDTPMRRGKTDQRLEPDYLLRDGKIGRDQTRKSESRAPYERGQEREDDSVVKPQARTARFKWVQGGGVLDVSLIGN